MASRCLAWASGPLSGPEAQAKQRDTKFGPPQNYRRRVGDDGHDVEGGTGCTERGRVHPGLGVQRRAEREDVGVRDGDGGQVQDLADQSASWAAKSVRLLVLFLGFVYQLLGEFGDPRRLERCKSPVGQPKETSAESQNPSSRRRRTCCTVLRINFPIHRCRKTTPGTEENFWFWAYPHQNFTPQ